MAGCREPDVGSTERRWAAKNPGTNLLLRESGTQDQTGSDTKLIDCLS